MNTLTAQVQQQGSITAIRRAGHLSSENAGPVGEAFQQTSTARKVRLVFHMKKPCRRSGRAHFGKSTPPTTQGSDRGPRGAVRGPTTS